MYAFLFTSDLRPWSLSPLCLPSTSPLVFPPRPLQYQLALLFSIPQIIPLHHTATVLPLYPPFLSLLPPGSLQNKLATLFTTVSPLVPTHPYSTTLPTPQSPLNPFPLFCLRKATWFQQATILLFSRPRQSTPFFMMQQIWK